MSWGVRMIGATAVTRTISRLRDSLGDDPTYGVGTDVRYAPFQEFGTIHHPPQPFLFPAANAQLRQAEASDFIDAGSMEISLGDGTRELAERIRDDAQSRAPVDTGTLRDSIEVREV